MIRPLAIAALLCLVASAAQAQAPAVLVSDPDASEVRALPLCTTFMTLPGPGQTYTCRPQWRGSRDTPTLEVGGLEMGPAGIESKRPLEHSAFVIGASVTAWLAREVGISLRYQYITGGPPAVDIDGDHHSDTMRHSFNGSLFSLGVRLRAFTDEVSREAWLFELEGGYLLDHDGTTPNGFVGQFAVGRQVGTLYGLGAVGMHLSLLLAGAQGFGDAQDFRMLSVVARFSEEPGPREPRDMGRPWHTADFDYVFGVRADLVGVQIGHGGGAGIASGLGLAFGIPFERFFEPRIETSFWWLGTIADRDVPLVYAGTAGLRIRLTRIFPWFIQVMGGYEFAFGTSNAARQPLPFGDGPIYEISTGAYIGDCRLGGALGFRYIGGAGSANGELQALMVFAELDYGSRSGSLGDRRRVRGDDYRCEEPSVGTVPTPPATR